MRHASKTHLGHSPAELRPCPFSGLSADGDEITHEKAQAFQPKAQASVRLSTGSFTPRVTASGFSNAGLKWRLPRFKHTSGKGEFMLVNRAHTAPLGQRRVKLSSPMFMAGVGRSIIAPF